MNNNYEIRMSKNYEVLYKDKTEDEVEKMDDVIKGIMHDAYYTAIDYMRMHYRDYPHFVKEDVIDYIMEYGDTTKIDEIKPDGVTDDEFLAAIDEVVGDIWDIDEIKTTYDTSSVIPDLKHIREKLQLTPLTRNTKI